MSYTQPQYGPSPLFLEAAMLQMSLQPPLPRRAARVHVESKLLRVLSTDVPPGLLVEGEVDLANRDLFATALRTALGCTLDSSRPEFHLDLGGVTFMDAAALGQVTGGAARLAAAGRVLTVHKAPYCVTRVLAVLGWADRPGLLLHCPAAA